MERSKSCTQFETLISKSKTNINNNNNNDDEILSKNIVISSSMKSLNQQQSQKLRQKQLQHQHIQYKGSSDNLINMKSATIKATSTTSTSTAHISSLPRYSSIRKKQFHRQTSSITSNSPRDRFHDDTDYHADLEDDAPEPQRLHFAAAESERTTLYTHHKQQQFAHHKPQSDSMLIHATAPSQRHLKHEDSFDSTSTMDPRSPASQRRHRFASYLTRDNSMSQSDSSRYSSVDSLLESRKPDPEAILINLGFGPVGSEDILSRIPKRFLKPSQVRGIDTEAFVKRLQLANHLADHSVLGYRGLTGNPDIPPSSIVAKIMARFEVNQRKKSMGGIE